MPDLLVRDIDAQTYERMKKRAKAKRQSLVQAARDALEEQFKPSKQELWSAADQLRAHIGTIDGNSTDLIREDRDNKEPYR